MSRDVAMSTFLQNKRVELGKTQEQIAEQLGCTPSQYARWEATGTIPKKREQRQKLADALKMTLAELSEKKGLRSNAANGENRLNMRSIIDAIVHFILLSISHQ